MRIVLAAIVALIGALSALAPATAGGGGACRGFPVTEERTTNVSMTSICFNPTIIRIDAGTTVTWTNDDPVPHAVSGANVSWGDYESIDQAESLSHTFDVAGVYPYYCFLHPGMIGAVVVEDADAESTLSGDTTSGFSRSTIAGGGSALAVIAIGAVALTARVIRRRRA